MLIPLEALEGLLSQGLATFVWPFFRVAGVVMVAPVFGARLVPARVRIALAVGVTLVVAPLLPPTPALSPSLQSGVVIAQELLLGAAMGFALQMIFDALVVAGQTIAMTMGLGFAMLVDPQRGVSVPVLSQFFLIIGILVFLSLDGHLATLAMLAQSFELIPIGEMLSLGGLWSVVAWGGEMFAGAVRVALPAVVAILVVNIAFGVMSRAAPTLNLFAVGFPSALLLGFLILLINVGNLATVLEELTDATFTHIATVFNS